MDRNKTNKALKVWKALTRVTGGGRTNLVRNMVWRLLNMTNTRLKVTVLREDTAGYMIWNVVSIIVWVMNKQIQIKASSRGNVLRLAQEGNKSNGQVYEPCRRQA